MSVKRRDLSWQLSLFDTVNRRRSVYPQEAVTCQVLLMCLLSLERNACLPAVISDGGRGEHVSTADYS